MPDHRYGPQPVAGDLASTVVDDLMTRVRAAHDHAADLGRVPDDDPMSGEDLQRARRRARWAELVPPILGDPRIDDLDPAIRDAVGRWAHDLAAGSRTSLVLAGPVGVGKSHAAYAALRVAVGADVTVAGGHVGELLDDLRPREGRGTDGLRRYVDAGILLLDDLGDDRPTDWTVERLGLLIHRRHAACRPMLVTTNAPTDDLRSHLEPHVGPRAVSRLADDHIVLRLGGADRRRTAP